MAMRTNHLIVSVVLLGVVISLSHTLEYPTRVKVNKLAADLQVSTLISSQVSSSTLYTIQERQIVTISKHTATTSYVIDIPNSVKSTATWDSIAVGSCDRKEADSCIYLAKISAVDRQLEILRFEEPEFNNGSSGTITVENFEKISIKLSSLDDTADSLFMLVEDDSTISLICQENITSLHYYTITPSQWSAQNTVVLLPRKVNLQHSVHIKLMDWNADSSSLLVQSSEDEVFIYKSLSGELSPHELLEQKPFRVQLRLPHLHLIQAICWDVFTDSLYAVLQGKHTALYSFKAETLKDYQNDQPLTTDTRQERSRSVDRRLGGVVCGDGNSMCADWAKAGNCKKSSSRDYMVQNCKLSCQLCDEQSSYAPMCQDTRRECSVWAAAGQCSKRPDYMHKNCAASCNRCPSGGTTQGGDRTQNDQAAVTKASVCKDRSEYCSRWADGNKCIDRKDYMNLKCPKSCGLCGQSKLITASRTEAKCKDQSEYCMIWQVYGYCKAKEKYMNENCPVSCNKCSIRVEKEVTSACTDKHEYCRTWASHMMCSLKPLFMKENCPASCDKCSTISNRILTEDKINYIQTTAVNLVTEKVKAVAQDKTSGNCVDKKQQCSQWAESGYCTRRPDYMTRYCSKSCGQCHSKLARNLAAAEVRESTSVELKPVKCEDSKSYCTVWAGAGLCQTRAEVMKSLCPASCKMCSAADHLTKYNTPRQLPITASPTTTLTSTPAPLTTTVKAATGISQQCKDQSKFCSLWKKAGRCATRKDYMKINCASTCQLCDSGADSDSKAACTDKSSYCKSWAEADRCHVYIGYMKSNCAKSCNFCNNQEVVKPVFSSNCVDDNKYCERWAEKGYCQIRPDYMKLKCRKSCNKC